MATPRPHSFQIASGATLVFGRSDQGTIVGGVWTPGKTGTGAITDASWASLPLNTWVTVNGTQLSQVAAQIAATGFVMSSDNLGSGKDVTTSLITWEGQALDAENGHSYHMCGGGHSNSSLNAAFRLELERMGGSSGWRLLWAPSKPNNPTYPWSATYKVNCAGSGSTVYVPDTPLSAAEQAYGQYDILPDGTPTSRHTYGDLVWDSIRKRVVMGRLRRWDFDPALALAGQFPYTNQRWYHTETGKEEPTDTNSVMFFHPATDTIVGGLPRMNGGNDSTYSWKIVNGASNVLNNVSPDILGLRYIAGCRYTDDDRILLVYDREAGEGPGIKVLTYNLSTKAVERTLAAIPSAPATDPMDLPSLCYVPEWGKAIRISGTNGTTTLIDPVNLTTEAYTPAGTWPAFTYGGFPTYPGNKVFYYPRRKCVVNIAPRGDNTPAVYVMRVG